MDIDILIKKEGINVIKPLSTLQVNIVAKNIADKLCKAFPEHGFNYQILFSNISRLNMFLANMPDGSACAKYVSENNSIYFSPNVSFENIDDLEIHECLHFLQEVRDKKGNLKKLGLANFHKNVSGIALNEAAVQLMASEANNNKSENVTYYNIELNTNTPLYYTLECAIVSQMSYFTGTYPLYNSTLTGSNLFKNTFIEKSGSSTFYKIRKNLDKLISLQDMIYNLTNDLQNIGDNEKKISQISKTISDRKNDVYNLFFKMQNSIMTSCFDYEFRHIRNSEELNSFKYRLYNYQYYIGKNEKYTFYNEFYNHTMEKYEEKQKYFEKYGYIPLGEANETALTLLDNEPNIFDLIRRFINKIKKLNGIKQEKINSKEF